MVERPGLAGELEVQIFPRAPYTEIMNKLRRRAHRKRIVIRNRRKRRQEKQFLRFGRKAKPTHKLLGGRTGSVHSKKTPPKEEQYEEPLAA